jgi:outer membrane lipoprotein-sorting protein
MFKKLFFLLVLTSTTFLMTAQSVEEILNNYFENTGGLEKWQSLESQRMEGKVFVQGMELPGTMTFAKPNKNRQEFSVQGMNIVQAYDGKTAWAINPFQSGPDPQKLPAEMAEDMQDQDFPSIYLNYKENGHTLEYEGTEEVEGTECYKIKATRKNGKVEYHFFDSEYFIPVMVRTTASSGPAKGQTSETFVSNYDEVDGMMLPFSIETKMNGQSMMKVTISKVELNPEIDDSIFAFPGEDTEEVVEEVVEEVIEEVEAAPVPAPVKKGEKVKKDKQKKSKKDKN